MKKLLVCWSFLAASVALAADPPAPPPKPTDGVTLVVTKTVTVAVGKKCVIVADTSARKVTWKVPSGIDSLPVDGKRLAVWAEPGTYTLLAAVPNGDDVLTQEVVLTVTGARPPPVPPQPIPPQPIPPQPVPPQPVTSFHVIFVHESGATIPQTQVAVMDAKAVRDWLTANTTPEGGQAGWRRKDKDAGATNDTPTMKALWDAVRPKVTAVPCVAIEVNGKVDIVPFEATPEAMLAVFKKYKGVQ